MTSIFIQSEAYPFCKGCGHHHVASNTVTALENLGLQPLDVVLVTDIGCHGIIDSCFRTHTVHGLHGRSVAIGVGLSLSLPTNKKVIIFIGDGGATIGLQHILEAARLNVDMTVVVHNNMLYGMTGGQPSGLTPCGYRTTITPQGSQLPSHDLCQLVLDAGAPFTARVIGIGDFSAILQQAIQAPGFALVEVLELCTSYGSKLNPELRLRQLAEQTQYKLGSWANPRQDFLRLQPKKSNSLLEMQAIDQTNRSSLDKPCSIVIGGSAGEGVQSAAELLALAAISCGLHVTKKSSYPVTVQIGFSTADLILSPLPILCHAFEQPDVALITSADGLQHNLERLQAMQTGIILIDASLTPPNSAVRMKSIDFRTPAGERNAAILAILAWLKYSGIIPIQSLLDTIKHSPLARHVQIEQLLSFVR